MLPRVTPSFMAPRDALTAEMRQSIVLKAIAYLQEIRLPRTLQELQTKFPHLPVELISRHEAVIVDATTMTMLYKPVVARKYARAVTNKTTMLSLLDEHPGGILLKDLEDAYAGAREDVAAMIKDGSVLQLENKSGRANDGAVVFPASVASVGAPVSTPVRDLWGSIAIPPTLAELEQKLVDGGHTVLTRVAPIVNTKLGQVKRGRGGVARSQQPLGGRVQNVANKHMQHLLRRQPGQ